MPRETITTQLRLLGEGAYLRGLYAAEAATRGLGEASIFAGTKSEWAGKKLDNLGTRILRYGKTAALGAGIATAAVAKMGLEFNANMERAEIGMTTLLKSGTAARKTVEDVRDFALKAPLFGVEQMMSSAQQMIGAGYDAKKIVPFLTTFSDTISAMGRKPEDLQRMTYAFVQMMSKGQITAEELRGQLGEIFPAQKILAKQMGITSRELAKKLKEGGVKGVEPLMLLFKGMEQEFGGSTERMSKTFSGQWANIKETAKYNAGVLFQPLFKELRDHVFPAVSGFSGEWIKVLENNRLTAKEKWQATSRLFEVYLKPQIEQWADWIRAADIPGAVADVMDKALPIAMNAAADAAPRVLGSFWDAWWHSDLWTKVFTASLLFAKMGVFSKVGAMVVGPFFTGFGEAMGGKKGQERIKKAGTKMGRGLGRFAGPAFIAALGAALINWAPDIEEWITKKLGGDPKKGMGRDPKTGAKAKNPLIWQKNWWTNMWNRATGGGKGHTGGGKPSAKDKKEAAKVLKALGIKPKAGGGSVRGGFPYLVGEDGPEIFSPKLSGTVIPNNLAQPALAGMVGGEIVVNSTLLLDGKVAARSVSRHNANVMARR